MICLKAYGKDPLEILRERYKTQKRKGMISGITYLRKEETGNTYTGVILMGEPKIGRVQVMCVCMCVCGWVRAHTRMRHILT